MNFRQRNLKVFHQRLMVQRVLLTLVVLNRLAELFKLTQLKAPSPIPLNKGGEGVFTFAYDTIGRRTKLSYPNGVTTTYSYDSAGRLTNLLTQNLVPAGFKQGLKLHTLDSFTYTHDKVGNRLSKTETDKKYDYSYDTIYRLLESMPAKIRHDGEEREFEHKAEIFTYDAVGNRLTGPKDKLNYTYNQGNQLTELVKKDTSPPRGEGGGEGDSSDKKKTDYSNDKNGNLTKKLELDDDGQIKRTTLYSYNYENRLTKVEIQKKDKVKVVTFAYDPFGRRLSKSVSHLSLRGEAEAISDDDDNDDGDDDRDEDDKVVPRTTYYVYDNEDIIMEHNHKGKVTARYVHGLGIDEPLAVEQKGRVYYYHFDGLGSVTSLTDSKGKVAQRYDYDSFGNLKRKGDKVKNTYAFTGREWDKETGLYYYRARYYDPKVGRFISKDPFPGLLNLPQTLNHYSYVGNNPVNWIDPWGLYWEYSQSTGQMTYVDNQSGATTPVGTGYSGQGAGYNNPNMQNVPFVGPIPQGDYDIDEATTSKGPVSLPLTPQQGTNTFGRNDFLIHGPNPRRPQNSSEGCIVINRNIRNQINNSQDRELRVVP